MSHVLVVGTYDPTFGRNRRIISMLQAGGHEVVICRADLWGDERHKLSVRRLVTTAVRAVGAYAKMLVRFLRTPRGDLVLVLYPGWLDVIVLSPLAALRRMPILFDVFISISDTVVSDRGMVKPRSVPARALELVDRLSLRRARRVIADTPSHAAFYSALGRIPIERVGVVWVGADDANFQPRPAVVPSANRVLFYGTFIALHGIDVVVRAAKLLEHDAVEVRIVGTGQEEERVAALLDELRPTNVHRIEHIPYEQLPDEIAAATVCLGIFGVSAKADRVVPNKVFECVAVGRPVITSSTTGIRSAFTDAEIATVPPGDPEALAQEIRRLLADSAAREAMAEAGRAHYLRDYATGSLTRLLDAEITATTAGHDERARTT